MRKRKAGILAVVLLLILAKIYSYNATILPNGGGSFTYSIPYNDFFAHYGYWYAEFPGANCPDVPITAQAGNLYVQNAINIYFYYTA